MGIDEDAADFAVDLFIWLFRKAPSRVPLGFRRARQLLGAAVPLIESPRKLPKMRL